MTGDFLVVESASSRKRPRGRAPKGCTWDHDTHQWVADATEIKRHGISIEDAGKNIVRVDLHAPKKKCVLWHTKGDVMKQATVEVFARGGNVSQAHKYPAVPRRCDLRAFFFLNCFCFVTDAVRSLLFN